MKRLTILIGLLTAALAMLLSSCSSTTTVVHYQHNPGALQAQAANHLSDQPHFALVAHQQHVREVRRLAVLAKDNPQQSPLSGSQSGTQSSSGAQGSNPYAGTAPCSTFNNPTACVAERGYYNGTPGEGSNAQGQANANEGHGELICTNGGGCHKFEGPGPLDAP